MNDCTPFDLKTNNLKNNMSQILKIPRSSEGVANYGNID